MVKIFAPCAATVFKQLDSAVYRRTKVEAFAILRPHGFVALSVGGDGGGLALAALVHHPDVAGGFLCLQIRVAGGVGECAVLGHRGR